MDYNNNLKELRTEKSISQRNIADLVGKTQPTYCDWENGKTQPDIQDLIKLADYFGVTIDYLVGREGEDGTFYVMGNELSKDETELVDKLRQLNPLKKEIVYQIVEVLTEQQRQGK